MSIYKYNFINYINLVEGQPFQIVFSCTVNKHVKI